MEGRSATISTILTCMLSVVHTHTHVKVIFFVLYKSNEVLVLDLVYFSFG